MVKYYCFIFTDTFAGTCSAIMIAAGIVGAVVTGVLADKTKKFEEITKTFFAFAIVSFAGFMVVSTHVVLLFLWLHLSMRLRRDF